MEPDDDRLDLALPRGLVAKLRQAAADTGASETEIVVSALKSFFGKAAKSERRRSDERLLAPLRSLVAEALVGVSGWPELSERLARNGLCLAASGGGLVLRREADGARLCKLSEVGPGYLSLVRAFGAPFPGHSLGRPLSARLRFSEN